MLGGFLSHSEYVIMKQSNCCVVLEQMSHRQRPERQRTDAGSSEASKAFDKVVREDSKWSVSLLQPKSNSVIKYDHLTFWVLHGLREQPMSWFYQDCCNRRRKTQRLSDMVLTSSLVYFLKS